jgi:hypothetical protein
MKKILLLLIAVAWTSSSCEKDDICDANTPTTPNLIINFYDISNPTLDKAVTNLVIIGEGLETGLKYNGVNSIKVPLKTTTDITKYKFILNYGNTANPEIVNEDNLQFNYTRNNIFVSRACGYKTIFILDNESPFVQTDAATLDGLWMQNITLSQPNIIDENEIHLKVSF